MINAPGNAGSSGMPQSQQLPNRVTNSVDVLNYLQSIYGSAQFANYEILRYPFYDVVTYPPSGTTAISFFSVPQGAPDPVSGIGKTPEQTNLTKSSSFGQVYVIINQIRTFAAFLPLARQNSSVQGIANSLYGAYSPAQSKLLDILGQGVLNISIGAKQYYDIQRPLESLPPGFGVDVQSWASATTTATTGPFKSAWVTQSPRARDVYTLGPVQMIEPEQQFQVTLNFPNGTSPSIAASIGGFDAALQIGVIFDGYVARPVQ